MSHIRGEHLKDDHQQEVEEWLQLDRATRMQQLKNPSLYRPAQAIESVPNPAETASFSGTVSQSAAAPNYFEMGRAQLSSEIVDIEERVQQAESFLITARPRLEELRRRLQISEQLVITQTTTGNGYGTTQNRTEEPRTMHA